MTRARGGHDESRDFEIGDEDGGKEEKEEEGDDEVTMKEWSTGRGGGRGGGGEDEEEEEGDEDDDESAWKHLFFPRLALSPLTKLVEAYPEWLPLSQLHEAAMGSGFGELQAVFMGCWADGVLESRATRNDSVDEDEFVDISTLQASSSAETRHGDGTAHASMDPQILSEIGSRRGSMGYGGGVGARERRHVQGIELMSLLVESRQPQILIQVPLTLLS